MLQIAHIIFDLSGLSFMEPFMRAEIEGIDNIHTADKAKAPKADTPRPSAAIRIVTDETTGEPDTDFSRAAADMSLPVCTLHCPYIVGTGMTGLMHRIAAGINSGRFVHIKGNDARISVVHATDVARAAKIAAGTQGTYTLTDLTDPTIAELSDALAYRLGDKRLFYLAPRWAKLWYGRSYFATLTSAHTYPCTFIEAFPDFHPVSVTNYLRTHVYDEKSL